MYLAIISVLIHSLYYTCHRPSFQLSRAGCRIETDKNQSKFNIKNYELNLNSKFISKSDLSLKLTEKEIEIILYLNETKTKHDVADLQKNIWGYSADMETHTVETHIYRLRKKISDKFNDENFILSRENAYFID